MAVLICTPAYDSKLHIDHEIAVMEMASTGIPIVVSLMGNESLIPRARNTMFSQFLQDKTFSHLFFLDADVNIKGSDFRKLYESGKDVVGAAVRLKGKDKIYNYHEILKVDNNYTATDMLGTACIMFSRKACEDLADFARKMNEEVNEWRKKGVPDYLMPEWIYDRRSMLLNGMDDKNYEMFDIFKLWINNKIYLSEDFSACYFLRKLGYDIWVDTSIVTRHNGTLNFD